MIESEILNNLNEQLEKARLELITIKNDYFPKSEFDEKKATIDLIKFNANRNGISIKSYIEQEVIDEDSKIRYLNLCKDEDSPKILNLSYPIVWHGEVSKYHDSVP